MLNTQPKPSITPCELSRLAAGSQLELIDVRTPGEFAGLHVPGARPLPLDTLDARAYLAQRAQPDQPIYVLCQSGGRARRAIEKFAQAGFHHCVLVEGGTQAWVDAGLPVVRGETTVLPLLRQVQITVGFVSAIGAVLALTVDPLFAVVPLLMGLGLLYAGLSGTCGLAWFLTKMPWNRAAGCSGKSCCVPSPKTI